MVCVSEVNREAAGLWLIRVGCSSSESRLERSPKTWRVQLLSRRPRNPSTATMCAAPIGAL